ncbi:SKA complex subunit 2 isoform X3 [Epinephelus lanceolatus]|uniref:spindle and kinetochore-associated protein 2 isoform X3 n=1 Tax=Epinephelus lanceolatus TaxID=310571 RepID=UPI001445CA6A|nr:spindle and kinetochore-associated protein 2 isoform X3 [Epinephelus lanceolatus]
METTVEKLEAMFLKSEADLDYIEKRLKLDFINSAAENGCPAEENPAVMLENLRAIKAKHTELCSQVKEIAAAQKESMDSIRNNLSSAMELVQHFQQTTDVEVQPLTESEQESAELLGSAVTDTTTQVPPAEAASGQQQPLSCEYEEWLPQYAEDKAVEDEGERYQAEGLAAPFFSGTGQERPRSPHHVRRINSCRLLSGVWYCSSTLLLYPQTHRVEKAQLRRTRPCCVEPCQRWTSSRVGPKV